MKRPLKSNCLIGTDVQLLCSACFSMFFPIQIGLKFLASVAACISKVEKKREYFEADTQINRLIL